MTDAQAGRIIRDFYRSGQPAEILITLLLAQKCRKERENAV